MTPEKAVNAVRTIEIKLPTFAQVEAFLRAAGYKPTSRLPDGFVAWTVGPNPHAQDMIILVENREKSSVFNFSLLAQVIERRYYQNHDERRCAQIISLIAEIEVNAVNDEQHA